MSARGVAYHPEAEAEFLAAIGWYEDQWSGLGGELLTELRLIEIAVSEHAETFPPAFDADDESVRQARVHRFPYRMVFFEDHQGALFVVAVAHSSQRPGYWKTRLQG